MSQHVFLCPNDSGFYAVLMGWDRPLQQYFLVVYRASMDDEPIYSNLYDDTSRPTLKYYLTKLEELNIELPYPMVEELIQDAANNAGNKEVLHQIIDGDYVRKNGFVEVLL